MDFRPSGYTSEESSDYNLPGRFYESETETITDTNTATTTTGEESTTEITDGEDETTSTSTSGTDTDSEEEEEEDEEPRALEVEIGRVHKSSIKFLAAAYGLHGTPRQLRPWEGKPTEFMRAVSAQIVKHGFGQGSFGSIQPWQVVPVMESNERASKRRKIHVKELSNPLRAICDPESVEEIKKIDAQCMKRIMEYLTVTFTTGPVAAKMNELKICEETDFFEAGYYTPKQSDWKIHPNIVKMEKVVNQARLTAVRIGRPPESYNETSLVLSTGVRSQQHQKQEELEECVKAAQLELDRVTNFSNSVKKCGNLLSKQAKVEMNPRVTEDMVLSMQDTLMNQINLAIGSLPKRRKENKAVLTALELIRDDKLNEELDISKLALSDISFLVNDARLIRYENGCVKKN